MEEISDKECRGGGRLKDEQNDELNKLIEIAGERLAFSGRTIVLTGAGVSKESGIPTFRDTDGIWQKYKPEELATREAFMANPTRVWKWYRDRALSVREKKPNPAHYALVELEALLPHFLLITQNIDNLHRRAGSKEIVELHGNIERFKCFEHSHPYELSSWGDEPPICHCGSLIRPDVVWFGEPLPQAELECAFAETEKCEVFLSIGTSAVVKPAGLLPYIAKRYSAFLIEINIEESEITEITDIFLRGKAAELLPKVVECVRKIIKERNKK